MTEENMRNQTAISKRRRGSELFQDANGAIRTHLEQPQIRLKTSRKSERFMSFRIRT